MEQADDFYAESTALYTLLRGADPDGFDEPTQFKAWTINAVLQHLHFWNQMAVWQVTDEARLVDLLDQLMRHKGGMRDFEKTFLEGLSGKALLEVWKVGYETAREVFAKADPKRRLKWAGPDMSARSSITARLMETWAHGQEVYDHLGVVRQNEDRIQNIVILGVNTFGWTYKTRGESPPSQMPYLHLTAPSGQVWTYGENMGEDRISGLAEEFCQVVTQTRNIADTSLSVQGASAIDWMSKAQCFAGPPETPPMAGSRKTRSLPS